MRILAGILLLCMLAAPVSAADCLDVSRESHHRLILETDAVRVFELELGRIESTAEHCHDHSYFYVSTTGGTVSSQPEGKGRTRWNMRPGEARFVYGPVKHVFTNEEINPYRQIEIESLRPVRETIPLGSFNADEFGPDQGSIRPTWTQTFSRGALSGTRSQIGPGDSVKLSGATRLVIAITDAALEFSTGETWTLSRGEIKSTPRFSDAVVKNSSKQPLMIVTVEF